MGFFSGIRRRIKKLIPKEVRPAIPFIAAAMIPGAGVAGLGPVKSKFLTSAIARGLSDDEADVKDIFRAGALAAAPTAISGGLGDFAQKYKIAGDTADKATMLSRAANFAKKTKEGIEGAGALKTVGAQTATDFGIKQAELNEKAIEEYNANLLSRGIKDKADRRNAIFSIFTNNGYDEDEVNVMLDKYGYADGGKVMTKASMSGAMDKYFELLEKAKKKKRKAKADGGRIGLNMGGNTDKIDPRAANFVAQTIKGLRDANPEMSYEEAKNQALSLARKEFRDESEDFDSSEFSDNLTAGISGLETAFGQPLGGRRPEPMRIIPGFASGGDVDEVMEFDEEIITPDYLMKEEGVPIQEQVSNPNAMDELNSLSLDLFGKPVFELTEDEFEQLKDFASQRASGYTQDELDMYEDYKYNMNEQMPGFPIMDIDDFLRMEYGAARMGVAKGGPIEKKKVVSIATGKLKDYPGIKKILEMNKKGKKRFSKADGGSASDELAKKIKELMDQGLSRELAEVIAESGISKEGYTIPKKAEGGLMNLAGNEMDLRGGGFVPMGKKERADDVPARLSKNEFVMTADAVRAAGGGSVQKGADLMYDTMKKLEAQS